MFETACGNGRSSRAAYAYAMSMSSWSSDVARWRPNSDVAAQLEAACRGPRPRCSGPGSPTSCATARSASVSDAMTQNAGTTSSRNNSYWSSPQITTTSGAKSSSAARTWSQPAHERGPVLRRRPRARSRSNSSRMPVRPALALPDRVGHARVGEPELQRAIHRVVRPAERREVREAETQDLTHRRPPGRRPAGRCPRAPSSWSSALEVRDLVEDQVAGVGPAAVAVRVVALDHHVVDADLPDRRRTVAVVDEAPEHVVAEQVAGSHVDRADVELARVDRAHPGEAEAGARLQPGRVPLEHVVGPFDDRRDPSDPAFRQAEPERRVADEQPAVEPVGQRRRGQVRRQRRHDERRARRRTCTAASTTTRCACRPACPRRRTRRRPGPSTCRRSCTDGSPSAAGFSEKVTARAPFAAHRSTSATARSASQSGRMTSGIRRPGTAPHHSSIIQSLYARTHARPRSRSVASVNSCPQKRGNAGKHSEALDAGEVEIRHPRLGLVAPGPQVLVALGEVDEVALARRGVEQAAAELGERLLLLLEAPDDLAVLLDRARALVLPLRGQPAGPDVGRLDHVVVDGDHPRAWRRRRVELATVRRGAVMLLLRVRAGGRGTRPRWWCGSR